MKTFNHRNTCWLAALCGVAVAATTLAIDDEDEPTTEVIVVPSPPPTVVVTPPPLRTEPTYVEVVPPPSPMQGLHYKCSELVGRTVENTKGQSLGCVKDLSLDFQSGRVAFVVLSSSGPPELAFRVVPPGALTLSSRSADVLCLDMTWERWEHSPVYQQERLAQMDEETLSAEIYAYYNLHWLGPRVVNKPAPYEQRGLPPIVTPTPTGRESGHAEGKLTQPMQLKFASDLVGRNVLNRQHEELGKVTDVVVDLTGEKTCFAIMLVHGGFPGGGDLRFAVPLRALSLGGFEKHVVVDASRQTFEQARTLDEKNWPFAGATSGSPEVFRYHD